jgi:glucose/arabinose dehydrogenase
MRLQGLIPRWGGLAIPLLLATLYVAPAAWRTAAASQPGGPTLTVRVAEKTSEHPSYQQGAAEGYVVEGIQGRDVWLQRGVTYTFQLEDVPPGHPFYLSTSAAGAGEGVYTQGVSGNFATGDETLTFTPDAATPDLLYYQGEQQPSMGGRIHVLGVEEVRLEPVASGLTAPVALAEPPDGSGRLFVADQPGTIRIIGPGGALLAEPFLDLRERMVAFRPAFDERGLLGLAFHPDYASNGRFFVYYSTPLRDGAPEGWDHTARISEFAVSAGDPDRADPASERVVLEVDEPQFNHNGGTVAFGPDGMLYVSLGDGGGASDIGLGHVADWYAVNEGGNAQAFDQNLLGAILRLDVDGAEPYAIPPDNPFVGAEGLDEVYAFGFRNPYRIAFDPGGTHELFAADAGQDLWEGVYLVEAGGNYGWNVREGRHCFNTEDRRAGRPECPTHDPDGRPLRFPVIEYPHFRQPDGLGVVVVGGHVYRGSALPEFEGRYLFGDWSRAFGEPDGRVFITTGRREDTSWPFAELRFEGRTDGDLGFYLLGFGQDLAGEVFVLGSSSTPPVGTTGVVYRLAPAEGSSADPDAEAPSGLVLSQNHPNPFSNSTTIAFYLSEAASVSLAVYDLLGRRVATLLDGTLPAGPHTALWDGTLERRAPAASGLYVIFLTSGEHTASRLVSLAR